MTDTLTHLDVSVLPRSRVIGEGENALDLADLFGDDDNPGVVRRTMQLWQELGHLKAVNDDGSPVDSFGFAMINPDFIHDDVEVDPDDPSSLAWFVAGWGPKGDAYIANAVRKLRPLVREMEDTLYLKHFSEDDGFENPVEGTDDEGNFPWGDFPHGGAVGMAMGNASWGGAVSVFKEDEDGTAALCPLGLIATEWHRRVALPRKVAAEAAAQDETSTD